MRLAFALAIFASQASAQTCGGPLNTFIDGAKAEAVARGISSATAERFFAGASLDPDVIKADRSQGVFQRDFIDFSSRLISQQTDGGIGCPQGGVRG